MVNDAEAPYFLLPRTLVEHPGFGASSVRNRLFLVLVIAEFQRRGSFYAADLELAVTLGVSVAKVREARRYFSGLGWIEEKHGFQSAGRNLATKYSGIPCCRLNPDEPGAYLDLFTYEVLLDHVRHGALLHCDLLTYVILDYSRLVDGDHLDEFEISLGRLRELTGLPGVMRSVRRLHRGFHFDGGSTLFSFEEKSEKLIITSWEEFAGPEHSDKAKQEAEAIRETIATEVETRRRLLRDTGQKEPRCPKPPAGRETPPTERR